MKIDTTKFGTVILAEAENLLLQQCIEKTNNNDGACITAIVAEYDRLASSKKLQRKQQLPYCAMTASVVLDRAFAKLNTLNTFRAAGAGDFISLAKKYNIRVDQNPAPGAIMLSKSDTSSGYHAGLVWYVEGNSIVTIEGNTTGYIIVDNCLKKAPHEGVVTKKRTSKSIRYFVHIEEWYGVDVASLETHNAGLAGLNDEETDSAITSGIACAVKMEIDDSTHEISPDSTLPVVYDRYSKYILPGTAILAAGLIFYYFSKKRG